jgi:hypothetical protein
VSEIDTGSMYVLGEVVLSDERSNVLPLIAVLLLGHVHPPLENALRRNE